MGSDFDGAVMPLELGDVTGLPRLVSALRAHASQLKNFISGRLVDDIDKDHPAAFLPPHPFEERKGRGLDPAVFTPWAQSDQIDRDGERAPKAGNDV